MNAPSREIARQAARDLLQNAERPPLVGVVVHHGLAELADRLADRREAPIRSLRGFETEPAGGTFVFGRLSGVEVVLFDPGQGSTAAQLFSSDRPIRILAELGVSIVVLAGPTRSARESLRPGDLLRLVELERDADPSGEGKGFDPALGELLELAARQEGIAIREAVIRAADSPDGRLVGADRPREREEVTGRWFLSGVRFLGSRRVRVVALAIVEDSAGDAPSAPGMATLGALLSAFVDGVSRRPSLLVSVPPPQEP